MTIAASAFAETPFASQNLVAISVSGVTLTSAVGSPSEIVGDSNFPHPLGLGMTVSLGQETGHVIKIPTGTQITSAIGFTPNDNLHINSTTTLTGLSLTNTLGSVSILATIGVDVTGQAVTLSLGEETITGTAVATPSGLALTLTPGSPVATGTTFVSPATTAATLVLGSPTVRINQTVLPTGIEITLEALPGSIFTGWHDVTTPTSSAWLNIDSGSGSTWSNINATTSGTWTNVDSSGNSTTWSNVTVPTDSNWTEQ